MPTTLHVRDVPDDIHSTLVHRAEARGMSLRRYTLAVLGQHCALPTIDEWLDEVARLPPLETSTSAAEAISGARDADDREIELVRRRR